jgi:1-acyl-sn-glycerol-3-phosphate acyltransferase
MVRTVFLTIISLPVFVILHIYTAIISITVIFLLSLHQKTVVRAIMNFWAKCIFIIIAKKLHIQGIENIDKTKKYILLANHGSIFDIPAIMSFYPGVNWFGKEYLLKIPLFGYVLKKTDYVPMRLANIKNTKAMLEQLKQKSMNHSVAIFPEGTRTMDGNLIRFHKGFIHLLRASKVDILPITLNGFFSLKPKTRFYIDFFSRITVKIHKPIKNEDLFFKSDDDIIKIIKDVIAADYINHNDKPK